MKVKPVITLVFCAFFLSSLIAFNGNSGIIVAETQNQAPLIELEESYFATSSEEFFNETSFPRYHLVARPFGMIQYPNKANPKIALFGEQINIIVNTTGDATDWVLTLVNGSTEILLDIIKQEYINETWRFNTLPSSQIEGLYDLQLNCSMGDDYQTHAVKLVESKQYPFNFIHISDTHFPAYNVPENINSTNINLGEFNKIKALNPDFVILTGDLIQGPTNMFLDPVTGKPLRGEIQLKLALWALDTLDLPIYYVHGNHEFSQTNMVPDNLEDNWYKYLGPIRYQNFTYLDWHMIGFGSSFEGLTSDEILEVRQIFTDNSAFANIFYYHYDFNNNPSNMIKQFPVELALYGHEHEDDLYRTGHTVYHKQAPLFTQRFSVITITNSTSVTLHDQTYNFDLTYRPVTNTEETSAYTFFITALVLLFIDIIIMKKKIFS